MDAEPLSQDNSIVNYENPDERDNSKLQVIFSNGIAEGNYKNPSTYKKAKALLLCWEEKSDDLTVKAEVERLEAVFKNRFHFEAYIETIDNNVEQRLQVCVNAIVANFVRNNDGPDNLLIVYYSGHARPGSSDGDLELFGQTSPNDKIKRLDCLVWNYTEDMLRPAAADVFEIFDCCYAGNLLSKKGPQTKFEYLAATNLDLTRRPGPDSFTSALIWALEGLADEGRFTTVDLLKKILEYPSLPEDQKPILSNRNKNSNVLAGRIMLHPLKEAGSSTENSPKEETLDDLARRQILTLHFEFDEKPTPNQIELLSESINEMFERNSVKVNGVRWGSMRSKALKAAAPFINSLQRIRRNSGSRQFLAPIDTSRVDGHSSQDSLAPPTPNSTGPSSPRLTVSVDSAYTVINVPSLSPVLVTTPSEPDGEPEHPIKRLRQS